MSRHVFIFEVEPVWEGELVWDGELVWEGEPPGEPSFICLYCLTAARSAPRPPGLDISWPVIWLYGELVWDGEPFRED